jgi:hypothetical protein
MVVLLLLLLIIRFVAIRWHQKSNFFSWDLSTTSTSVASWSDHEFRLIISFQLLLLLKSSVGCTGVVLEVAVDLCSLLLRHETVVVFFGSISVFVSVLVFSFSFSQFWVCFGFWVVGFWGGRGDASLYSA